MMLNIGITLVEKITGITLVEKITLPFPWCSTLALHLLKKLLALHLLKKLLCHFHAVAPSTLPESCLISEIGTFLTSKCYENFVGARAAHGTSFTWISAKFNLTVSREITFKCDFRLPKWSKFRKWLKIFFARMHWNFRGRRGPVWPICPRNIVTKYLLVTDLFNFFCRFGKKNIFSDLYENHSAGRP